MLFNRRKALAAVAGMFCLPFGRWFGRATTEVGFEFGTSRKSWYWVSFSGNRKEKEFVIDWVCIIEDRETGETVKAEVMFEGLGKFQLHKGPPPERYLPTMEV